MDPRESYGETRRQSSSQTSITPSQSSTPTSCQQTLITFHQIQCIVVPMLCCMSKWLSKVEVSQWGMFHETTELLSIGCLTRLIWTPRSKSVFNTKHQLADMLTKRNFTRDEWNHLLSLFNISHFSSTACTTAMATFFICSISAISALLAAPRISAW